MVSRLTRSVVFMRGGTSKGLFFHERDLPVDPRERDRVLLEAMGSPDPYGRQLDGMGGGLSSLSKIIIVRPSLRAGADVEYLHGQVAIDRPLIDYSANCGNLSAAVGPFAIDTGLIPAGDGPERVVRLHNLNAGALIHACVPVRDGAFLPTGDFAMPGVAGTGGRIALEYFAEDVPFFPTGHVADTIALPDGRVVRATLAAGAIPCVFVNADDIGIDATATPSHIDANARASAMLEAIRRAATVRMGLASSEHDVPVASPKIGVVGPPAAYEALDGARIEAADCDILVRMISVGQAHRAVPLTAAMCLAAACFVRDSVPHGAAVDTVAPNVRIGTPSGVVTIGARLRAGLPVRVDRTIAYATARRLMEGRV